MNANPAERPLPPGWHSAAAAHWAAGRQAEALGLLMQALNDSGPRKPTPLVLQLVYYMFQRNDWASAAACLKLQHDTEPDNLEVLINLAACLSRSGQAQAAVQHAQRYLRHKDDEPMVWDILAANLPRLKHTTEARQAGTQALLLKERRAAARAATAATAHTSPHTTAHAPSPATETTPAPAAPRPDAVDVIAFSLWGTQARYLLGMLDNLLAARELYPSWQLRIHLDNTVPANWQALFQRLGAHLVQEAPGQSLRQRLCWRFKVANDAGVHRFMVRDCDSVVSAREQLAVHAWLASSQPFHVMRDWWTHTDPMLAGMWGGHAGLLPDLQALLMAYQNPALETPNIDQWFLRDEVWLLIKDRCLVHDRCFTPPGAQPWPGPEPEGKNHVGQNVHAVEGPAQFERLKPWLQPLAAPAGP